MSDLTKIVPQVSPIVTAIYKMHENELAAEDAKPRLGRVGGAAIGGECDRAIWYAFRKCCKPSFDGRMHRLFETGHLAEPRFVRELRAIGCRVEEFDANGEQFAVSAIGGHFGGYLDCAILGVPGAEKTWHVGEFKTHSSKNFKRLEKGGVEKEFPKHYTQMQVYMGRTKMKRALYLASNKDTDELYAERFHFGKEFYGAIMGRAKRIITTNTPPERAFNRRDHFKCNWCDAQTICWGDASGPAIPVPSISCRQCCHATPSMDGHASWICDRHGRGLCVEDQDRACGDHLVLPGLLEFAEAVDHGVDADGNHWIDFAGEGGEIWKHGAGGFSTDELRTLPATELLNPLVEAVKKLGNVTVTAYSPDDILTRFPASLSVWSGAAYEIASEWKIRYGEDLDLNKQLGTVKDVDYNAIEMPGGRCVVHTLPGSQNCEIRELK